MKTAVKTPKLLLTFKPLLWSLKWEDIDIEHDKADIILAAINEGTMDHWRWILRTYGKSTIQTVLNQRLETELHPESQRLATLLFDIAPHRHAR
ncbi:MAG: hypothetical protein AAB647_02710 [Patescibacteria group bacterium]